MANKEDYRDFVNKNLVYIPIYSKPWWLDAVCGENNWDVWLYWKDGKIMAVMPYYYEVRKNGVYITKAPLTQNNGIIYLYPKDMSNTRRQSFREHVIDKACDYIESLNVAVYEQQYHYTFDNYLPFFWRGYKAIPRYTYVIDTHGKSEEELWGYITSKQRSIIKKGKRNGTLSEEIGYDTFYSEHEKIFTKQGLKCPFSIDLWGKLYHAVDKMGAGKIVCYKNANAQITSLAFVVWDERSSYLILGGGIPEFQNMDTYAALIWDNVCLARERGLLFDFEGSMIKRISKAFAEYGGMPKEYYRIRKVFRKEIAIREVEDEYK